MSAGGEDQSGEGGVCIVEISMTGAAKTEPMELGELWTSEESGLLGDTGEAKIKKESKEDPETVFFKDGQRRVDFILTYKDDPDNNSKSIMDEKKSKRQDRKKKFLENCEAKGLQFEEQHCSLAPDRETYYLKIHGTHDGLLKAAEDMLLRMPLEENKLRKLSTYRESFFERLKLNDPFEPVIPQHLKRTSYFTAPFNYNYKEKFIGYDDKERFFTTAQRAAIVDYILNNTKYGDKDKHVGVKKLLSNETFSDAFPLHESSEKMLEGQTEKDMTDRQLLYSQWSHPKNWYKRQPLNQVRRYFGEEIGIYFTWLGFYTTWLLPASIIGIIVTIVGLFTIIEAIPDEVCDVNHRYDFYMCPPCAVRCDFWYLYESCAFSRMGRIFDNGATVFFAIFMAFWAAFFLEFWKRRQFFLQYEWDVLGYEEAEQLPRPKFVQKIKFQIGDNKEKKKEFTDCNPVTGQDEYFQPLRMFYPKVVATLSILFSMIMVIFGIMFSVIIYRLAIGTLIYSRVSGTSLGPAVGSIIVSVTGAIIQLIAIVIMNKVYEKLAIILTEWENHRLQTEYNNNFITKMYLFQFVNLYTSLFYIAFIKGNATGIPGNYSLIGNSNSLRIDECPAYGCLLELTIQLSIIMVGKQALNNIQEIVLPYVKYIIRKSDSHKNETKDDVATRWEKDNDLMTLSEHGLFYEYLELVVQYGFTTLFVSAFPLAPFFALLNNYFEIRIDAHKFVSILRRPVPKRAGDIGAWYHILSVITYMAIVINALLIAFTSQIIPISIYQYGGYRPDDLSDIQGYVNWSLSPFTVEKLIDGGGYPAFSAHLLQLYNGTDTVQFPPDSSEEVLYLPYVNFDCVQSRAGNTLTLQSFDNISGIPDSILEPDGSYIGITKTNYRTQVANNAIVRDTILISAGDGDPITSTSSCFNGNFQCRYQGFARDGGFEGEGENRQSVTIFGRTYWQVISARLAFVVLFEHIVILIVVVISELIPDVPKSVKLEIQREKLLANEAKRNRKDEPKKETSTPAATDEPVATTFI